MPLTAFQREVLALLAANRNPESHLAGGTAINRSEDSPRFSADVDLFHDVAEAVHAAALADAAVLAEQGYAVEWQLLQPFLRRARVLHGNDALRLDWCYDSAFRFFPVQPDPEFGYCLHPADLATNKALALAGRSEIRDFLDILHIHQRYLSLGAVCWAACGKDQGFTPWSLLDLACRHMKFRQEDLEREHLARPVVLVELKDAWLKAADEAERLFAALPPSEAGSLYLRGDSSPCVPEPAAPEFAKLIRHTGSIRGAWPKPS